MSCSHTPRRRLPLRVMALLSALSLGQLMGAAAATTLEDLALDRPGPEELERASELGEALDRLEARVEAAESAGRSLREYHAQQVAPLVAYLQARSRPWTRNRRGTANLHRVVVALIREGRREGIDPRLLAAMLLVENPWIDPFAQSPVGAVGLMQVMPFHAGSWGCGRTDLTHVETNVCHGTKILAAALRRTQGDLDAALLRYNGCLHGTNTPDCHRYPSKVYRFAEALAPPSEAEPATAEPATQFRQ